MALKWGSNLQQIKTVNFCKKPYEQFQESNEGYGCDVPLDFCPMCIRLEAVDDNLFDKHDDVGSVVCRCAPILFLFSA